MAFLDVLLPLISRSQGSADIYSLTGRIDFWPLLINGLANNMLIGYGSGGLKFDCIPGLTYKVTHAHNQVLTVWFYYGLPLLMLHAGGWAMLIKNCSKNRFGLSIFVFFMISGLLEVGPYNHLPNFLSIIFFLLICRDALPGSSGYCSRGQGVPLATDSSFDGYARR